MAVFSVDHFSMDVFSVDVFTEYHEYKYKININNDPSKYCTCTEVD